MKCRILISAFAKSLAYYKIIALLLLFLLAVGKIEYASAYDMYKQPDSMTGKTMLIPSGTTFEGRIDTTIGSTTSHPGTRFAIVLASPVIANGVDVVIPAGAQVLGEVVEAISSSHLPHQKGYPKPTGKLRVQLTTLRMPDGVTYPFVASLAGETIGVAGRSQRINPQLGGGVAYMGSQANFAAVAPGAASRFRSSGGRGPTVVSKNELQKDPLYGKDPSQSYSRGNMENIRSLVKKGHNLYIYSGSPLTIRLDAPLKIGMAAAPSGQTLLAPTFGQNELETGNASGRRFLRAGEQPNRDMQTPSSVVPSNPLPGILPDYPGAFVAPNPGVGTNSTSPMMNQPVGQGQPQGLPNSNQGVGSGIMPGTNWPGSNTTAAPVLPQQPVQQPHSGTDDF